MSEFFFKTFQVNIVGSTKPLLVSSIPVKVPTACAKFANEILAHPDSLLRVKYPHLLQSKIYPDGGHFAAFELPEVLAADVYNFVEKIV